jgi:signal transduction histidine kinase
MESPAEARNSGTPLESRGAESLQEAELAAALSVQGEAVAHKVKNPLASIMLAASRLKKFVDRTPGSETPREVAEELLASIDRLSKKVDAVLDAVVPPPPRFSAVDLDAIAAAAAREADLDWDRDLPGDLPRARSDPDLLRLALCRLLAWVRDGRNADTRVRLGAEAADADRIALVLEAAPFPEPPGGWEALLKPFSAPVSGGGTGTLTPALSARILEWLGARLTVRPDGGEGFAIRIAFPAESGNASGRREEERP